MHQIKDGLSHFHLLNYRARAVVAVTTEVVKEAQRRHNLDPLTTIALGRAISAISLLASTLKDSKDFILGTFHGDGVLKKVVAECNGNGDCRGYCLPHALPGDLGRIPGSVGEALGKGGLAITRGKYGENNHYTANVQLLNGEIASDIARFLTESEQIPSAVASGVKLGSNGEVLAAGGMLVQKLGGAILEESELGFIEERMAVIQISEKIYSGANIEFLVKGLQREDQPWGLLTHRELTFRCRCSREKMALTAMMLGEKELRQIMEEVGKIELSCSYCASVHQFSLDELQSH